MRKIDYLELGGTLYIPANHKNLKPILLNNKYPFLTSVVVCFEDSIKKSDVSEAMKNFQNILNVYNPFKLKVFVRGRDFNNLKEILKFRNIEKIDGFVLPKINLKNVDNYFALFKNNFYLMPTIEEILEDKELKKLSKKFKTQNILSVRVGIEDILGSFGIVRKCEKTYFENLIMDSFLSKIFFYFKKEFNVSAPVFPCFENEKMLKKELKIETELQIFNKTIIHPNQAKIINQFYKVSQKEFEIASLMMKQKDAIFEVDKRMYEYATHKNWAKNILKRQKIYGLL